APVQAPQETRRTELTRSALDWTASTCRYRFYDGLLPHALLSGLHCPVIYKEEERCVQHMQQTATTTKDDAEKAALSFKNAQAQSQQN
uniref:hypothetical protein n=1 Tax=Xanthomonas euvesicatoria TaxID=456327 RepID=UPI0019D21805